MQLNIFKTKLFAVLILILLCGETNIALAGDYRMYFTQPMSILVNGTGTTPVATNMFTTQSQDSQSPNDIGDPGMKYGLTYPSGSAGAVVINGNTAYPVKGVPGLYYSLGLSVNGGDITYAPNSAYSAFFYPNNPDKPALYTAYEIFTTYAGTTIQPGTYQINQTAGYFSGQMKGALSAFPYGTIYNTNTITVTASTCQLQTPRDISIQWPSMSPSEVQSYSAEVKPAAIQTICQADNINILVTVSSSNGSNDAANGIVNTNKANLGLKLTWASDGQPVILDQQRDFGRGLTRDFTINAQPVGTGGGISGGDFTSDVTVTFEYR